MKTIYIYLKRNYYLVLLLGIMLLGGFKYSAAQTKHIIEVSSTVFTPDDLEIEVGDTVEWQNIQGFHNVNGTQSAYPDNPEYFGNNTGSGWTYSYVFNTVGKYDYHCDPHVDLGMTGEIRVKESDDGQKHHLVINFSGMDPHNNQMLYLRVYEKNSGKEIERTIEDVSPSFTDSISGIEQGQSYYIDFFADHNSNGMYDTPPTDHAWRLELNDVTGDTTLNFAHNTNFTDIMWQHQLTLQFSGMTPHVGQMLKLYVVNSEDGLIKDSVTVEEISDATFEINSYSLISGESYHINFFADFNQNGSYDIPPTDHAWRIMLENVAGDTTLLFAHNTDFTDIFSSTSVSETHINTIRIYPNPATDFVTIEINELISQKVSISVYDITGKLNHVQERRTNNKSEIDVQKLKQGIYFVEIKTHDQRKMMKLIKE